MTMPLLEVRELVKHYPVRGGILRRGAARLKAVDGVSLELETGRTLGLVGESGCGKTTLGRSVLRLIEPTSGQVILDGEDITALAPAALKKRRRDMQMIFQDPYASLSPRRTVLEILREPLDVHRIGPPAKRRERVSELLDTVGLGPRAMRRYPHEFSGGELQRIGIARALALNPKFIVADEAVSALDASVQSQVLNLITDLQAEFGIAYLFISHDLAVIQHVSDDVAVMYLGKVVERAPAGAIFRRPGHPYTQALLAAVPVPDPKRRAGRIVLRGEAPSPVAPPPGCPFHTRCPSAMEVCRNQAPRELNIGGAGPPHRVVCHLHDPRITPDGTGREI